MSSSTVQAILDREGSVAAPGIYDTLSAKLVEAAGFPLGFVSGYGVSATTIGEPDIGLLTQTEMRDRAQQICRAASIPILVDADTGYGNALNVHRTVEELIAAGAAGCFLEDQVWPKRCGHMQGKSVISREQYAEKIRAAVAARANRDFFIVARSDAEAIAGLDEAIDRVLMARDLGADACFVEAPQDAEQLARIGQRVRAPAVANMISGGQTPLFDQAALQAMGFQLILHPLAGLYAAAAAVQSVCTLIKQNGHITDSDIAMMTFDEFNSLIGLESKHGLAQRVTNP